MRDHSLSRRAFVRSCAAGAAVVAFGAGRGARGQDAKPRAAGKYIDVHTHLGQTWNHTRPLGAKELLEWMDANDVAQAVVLPLVSPESSSYLLTSDFVLEETKPHRDRLIPFCCIDPRTTYSGKRHGLRHMIQQWVDKGAKGFGEHKPGVAIDHPGSQEIYAVCGELKLPLLFHLEAGSQPRNEDAPGLPGLERMLKAFPDTIFIGHGPGWWASISGDVKTPAQLAGYPKTKVAPGGAMDRLMEAYPNIYSDLSAGSGNGALARDLEFAKAFITRRADRIMFGTDYLASGQAVPQFETFADKLELPEDVRAKVYRENARRVLRLG